MTRITQLALLCLIALTACWSQGDWFERNVPRDQETFARQYLELLQAGRTDSARQLLVPTLRDSVGADRLREISVLLESAALDSAKLVAANILRTGAERHARLTFEAPVADSAWVLAGVYVKDGRVRGVSVQPTKAPLAEVNAFRLRGKSATHYVTLGITALVPLVCLAGAIGAVARRLRRRWLWALFALVGVGKFAVNWTTGSIEYSLVNIQLLGAGIVKGGPYAPWILSFSFPLGALIVFEKLRRRASSDSAA